MNMTVRFWNKYLFQLNMKDILISLFEEAEKLKHLENKKIPEDIDYDVMHNLASEAKQKLKEVRPLTIGQAMRISGVNPADISILTMYMKRG